jgi:hypothetical protein
LRTIVIAVVIAALAAGFLLLRGGDEAPPARPQATFTPEYLSRLAGRVERLRGHRFRKPPIAAPLSAKQTRAHLVDSLDRDYPRAQRRADERLLVLLGLLPAGTSIDKLLDDIAGSGVAGFYDPDRKRLFVVREAAVGPVTLESTLAHELTHALDDDRFGLHNPPGGIDDRSAAYAALVEGSATHVQSRYMQRYIGASGALGGLVELLGVGTGPDLPPYIQASTLFPYLGGESFIADLYSKTGDWSLVDFAIGKRAPDSTEQILHPEKFLRFERPVKVRLPRPGPGWRRLTHGSLGEFDTGQLLELGKDFELARRGAAGWGGGSIGLWRRGSRDLLVAAWAGDSERDARELADALRPYVVRGLNGRGGDGDEWDVDGAAVVVRRRGDRVALVMAPEPREARRLAAAAVRAG